MTTQLRFVHAAGLRLDSPLRDVPEVPENLREIVEDATLTAFEAVVAHCLDQDVDFLLLGGDTFDAGEHGLRARVALLAGLEKLQAEGVPVLVAPGPADPASAWDEFPDLPDNVTVLRQEPARIEAGGASPVRIAADEAEASGGDALRIGTRHSDSPHAGHARDREQGPHPACDYLALVGAPERTTTTIAGVTAHAPGPAQPLNGRGGSGGCSLVRLRANGKTECEFLPTAAVLRERHTIDLQADDDLRTVAHRAAECLRAGSDRGHASLLFVEWRLRGPWETVRGLVKSLDPRVLGEQIAARHGGAQGPHVLHAVRAVPHDECGATEDALLRNVFAALAELDASRVREAAAQRVLPFAESPHGALLRGIAEELDPQTVLDRAGQLAATWHSERSHEGEAA